jgi:hypothetical protein
MSHLRTQAPELVGSIRIELYGTMLGWREGEPRHLAELACEQGLGDLITEHPGRISYRRSVELLVQSDGALVLGVDDAGYMPSKLFSYALSGKPLLASLRQDGPAFVEFQRRSGLGHAIWFGEFDEMPLPDATATVSAFLREVVTRRTFDRRRLVEPFLAATMARKHVALFEECLPAATSDLSCKQSVA